MTIPLYPRKLISFRNLAGGQFGTLDVTAREAGLVELALGADYVWLTPQQWLTLRAAIDPAFGIQLERETVVVATDDKGDPMVIEEVERVVTKKRAKGGVARRTRVVRP